MTSRLADCCKAINNASHVCKSEIVINFINEETIAYLIQMQKHGYISRLTLYICGPKSRAVVNLTGRLNKCGAICPQFRHKVKNIQKRVDSLLPSMQYGHVIFETDAGFKDQSEALKANKGGKIIGFFY